MTLRGENSELRRRLAAAEELLVEKAMLDAALRESEARHRLLIESWAQAVWETDPNGVVVADSPSWRAYTGQTLEEWLGYGWLDAIHPDDRAYAERQWREAVSARGLVNAEFRLRAPDGGWRWTNVRAVPLLDAAGNIEKWLGLNIDINARKQAEAALREGEERYRALFECMDEAYAVVEVLKDDHGCWADFRFLEVNEAFLKHTTMPWPVGQTATELLGSPNPRWTELYGQALDTGRPLRVEEPEATLGLIFDLNIFSLDRSRNRVAVLFTNITERKRAEAELRASEERQAFLLALGDRMRAQDSPQRAVAVASRMLGERLGATRVVFAEVDEPAGPVDLQEAWLPDGIGALGSTIRLSDFRGPLFEQMRTGQAACYEVGEPPYSSVDLASLAAIGVKSALSVPLVVGGRVAFNFNIQQDRPRVWTDDEQALTREVAERIWAAFKRARAEEALRKSEERFRQFARASAAALWIRDAETLDMEFASPAIEAIYGVPHDALLGDVKRWAAMIVPEDREVALKHLDEARAGNSVMHEFRIRRASDSAFRWIRNTDFPLRDDGHIPRIGGIAEDVTEAKLAVEHQGVLLAELQHRVRNIMAMIRSMANRTAGGAASVGDYQTLLEGRLLALARVQTLLTRQANAGGSLANILASEIGAQAHGGGQYALTGPEIMLSPKMVEVLTLAFHELATNALKYGALSVEGGRLSVWWSLGEKRGSPWLILDWTEEGAPLRAPPTHRGFGSELIERRVPYELKGTGKLTFEPEGLHCHLELPLSEAGSILETDAPVPTTVFGGSLDMSGAPDLTGKSVLVVEDDFYLATDTAAALQSAGAEVLGPCPREDDVLQGLESATPDAAVVDLNLGGGGPRFEIARLLKARPIPFVFLTGYDPDVIPADMAEIIRLQKPIPLRSVVEAVGKL